MDQLVILAGKTNERECYSLLDGRSYFSYFYDGENHEEFMKKVAEKFGRIIIEKEGFRKVGILNGYHIDDGEFVKTERVEDISLLELFLTDFVTKSMPEGHVLSGINRN